MSIRINQIANYTTGVTAEESSIVLDLLNSKDVEINSKNVEIFKKIKKLPNCTSLSCRDCNLTKLPELRKCNYLYCQRNQLTQLPFLPVCWILDCSHNQLTKLPYLFECLVLRCKNNILTELHLGRCTELDCSNNEIINLPNLPNCQKLDCSNNKITRLPEIQKCKELHCQSNRLSNLPKDVSNIEFLNCSNNEFTELPQLQKCKILICQKNQLSELPSLPKFCKTLDCQSNRIKHLPDLLSCKILDCSINELTEIQELPKCEKLNCSMNQITILPVNLPECKELDCSINEIIQLPNLPQCEKLDCSYNPIKKLPDLPNCPNPDIHHTPIEQYMILKQICFENALKDFQGPCDDFIDQLKLEIPEITLFDLKLIESMVFRNDLNHSLQIIKQLATKKPIVQEQLEIFKQLFERIKTAEHESNDQMQKKMFVGFHSLDKSNVSSFKSNAYNAILAFRQLEKLNSQDLNKFVNYLQTMDPKGCLDYKVDFIRAFFDNEYIADYHQPFLTNVSQIINSVLKEQGKISLDKLINLLNTNSGFKNFLFAIISHGLPYGGVVWIKYYTNAKMKQSQIYKKYQKQLNFIDIKNKYPFFNWKFITKKDLKGQDQKQLTRLWSSGKQTIGGFIYNGQKGKEFIQELIQYMMDSYILDWEKDRKTGIIYLLP